jgi:glutamate racemase
MIGIFDSGLGGLTALKEIHALTPGEELVTALTEQDIRALFA